MQTGIDHLLITELQFRERPKDVKARIKDARYLENTIVCAHEEIPLEIQGTFSATGKPIIGIKIAHSSEDTESYFKVGFRLEKNLSVFGCKSTVWILREREAAVDDTDGDLYPLGHLEAMLWTDDKLIKCVKVQELYKSSLNKDGALHLSLYL